MTLQAYLYTDQQCQEGMALNEVENVDLGSHCLLWIDTVAPDAADYAAIADRLRWQGGGAALARAVAAVDHPQSFGDALAFAMHSVGEPVENEAGDQSGPRHFAVEQSGRLVFIFDHQMLVTLHHRQLSLLARFRAKDRGASLLGQLTPATLAATLADWTLQDYFAEISVITDRIDGLDQRVLRDTATRSLLGRIVAVRQQISRVRALLVACRPALYGLARPDLSPFEDPASTAHFQLLTSRFERALDEIERVRDLVNGSFELFSSRNALQTNRLVKVLTVVTAIFGYVGATAGIFGMNIHADFFEWGDRAFWILAGILVSTSALAVLIALRRRWL